MNIPVNKLIERFQLMYREHWRYTWGHSADGDVDCSGAFANAYRHLGHSIAHGSNTIARSYVKKLLPVSSAEAGMAAFKIRKPGDKYYDLPAKFKPGGSAYNGDLLNDYYHIGLVDEGGKYVLNAQGVNAGFTRTKISTWGAVGYLKDVDYSKEMNQIMQTMKVTSKNGDPVRVRKAPGTDADVITKLKVGTLVEAGDDRNGWREIVFGDEGGWMMSQFLATVQTATETDLSGVSDVGGENPQAFTRTLSASEYNRLCEVRDHLESDLSFLKTIVGVG